jgi:hypothetical protein
MIASLYEFIENLTEDGLTPKEQRAKFILDKMGTAWQGLPGYTDINSFVEKVAQIDPTAKGIYMPWIARLAISNPTENRAEDLDRVGNDLNEFERFKSRIANKDINSYKSFDQLFSAIEPFLVKKAPTAAEKAAIRDAAKLAKIKDQIVTVFMGSPGWIRIPTTKAAAQFLGQGTRWCTAATNMNMFDHYNQNDVMFVIYDKQSKKRSQLHIQSGQFANEADKNMGVDSVPEWARQPIVDYYKATNPQLTFKQIMGLNKFTDENLAAGTEHEDILNLMKQYGV